MDSLVKLNRVIDWNLLAGLLSETTAQTIKNAWGAFDRMMLFKMLVLQRMNNQSDNRPKAGSTELFEILRFLGLYLAEIVPNAKTIWLFLEKN